MQNVVAVLGVFFMLLSVVGLTAPQRLRAAVASTASRTRFLSGIVLRLGIGSLLWIAADGLRFPFVMRTIAAISIAAAVAILIMGPRRLDRLVDWWLARSDGLFRLSFFLVAIFGGFLVYVAV